MSEEKLGSYQNIVGMQSCLLFYCTVTHIFQVSLVHSLREFKIQASKDVTGRRIQNSEQGHAEQHTLFPVIRVCLMNQYGCFSCSCFPFLISFAKIKCFKNSIPASVGFKGSLSFLFALLWKLWGPEIITGQYHEDFAIPAAFHFLRYFRRRKNGWK